MRCKTVQLWGMRVKTFSENVFLAKKIVHFDQDTLHKNHMNLHSALEECGPVHMAGFGLANSPMWSRESWFVAVSKEGRKGWRKKGIKERERNKGKRTVRPLKEEEGMQIREEKRKLKSIIINTSYSGRNIQPKGPLFPPSTSSKQFPLIRKHVFWTHPQ